MQDDFNVKPKDGVDAQSLDYAQPKIAMADGPKLFQFWGGLRVNICKNDEDTQ